VTLPAASCPGRPLVVDRNRARPCGLQEPYKQKEWRKKTGMSEKACITMCRRDGGCFGYKYDDWTVCELPGPPTWACKNGKQHKEGGCYLYGADAKKAFLVPRTGTAYAHLYRSGGFCWK
jgi:hypothetical protein